MTKVAKAPKASKSASNAKTTRRKQPTQRNPKLRTIVTGNVTIPPVTPTIEWTDNYSQFTTLPGNRPIDPSHVRDLVQSMRKKYLFTAIYVVELDNDLLGIIDGQHRLEACRILKLPVYYIKVPSDYGLEEIQLYNNYLQNWTIKDFLDTYLAAGYEDYRIYKEFREKYGFDHKTTLAILSNGKYSRKLSHNFKDGTFVVTDIEFAQDLAEKLFAIKKYYRGYSRRTFVNAMLAMLRLERFDYDEFMRKLDMQPSMLKDVATTDDYRLLIESIYNYKSRDKINLRFD